MFTCTVCGLRKSKLENNGSEFEFRRRRQQDEKTFVNGLSEWCPKCQAVRFYFWIDNKKEPLPHLEELPKKEKVVPAIAPTPRKVNNKLTVASQARKMQHELCHEAHTQLKREIIEGSPEKPPRACARGRQIRSQSEARKSCRNSDNLASRQRSRSVLSVLGAQKACRARPQAEQQRSGLGAIKPLSKDTKEDHAHDGQGSMQNSLHEHDNEKATTSRAAKRQQQKQTADIKNQQNLADRWQETSLLNSNLRQQDSNLTAKEASHLVKKRFMASTFIKSKKPLIRDVEIETDDEIERQLNKKLVEKKLLVDEWECIRRRVNNEWHRVNAELDELKYEADLEIERNRIDKLALQERQVGGAHLLSLSKSIDQEKGEGKNWMAATETLIGDALNESLNLPKKTSIREEMPLKEDVKNIFSKGSSGEKTVPKQVPTKKCTKLNTKSLLKCIAQTVSQRRLRNCLRDKHLLKNLNILASSVQRACFRGFPEDPQKALGQLTTTKTRKLRSHPPQFTTKPCSSKELFNVLCSKPDILEQKSPTRALKVCRAPVICPDADCRGMFFISDFNAHLQHEHSSLPMERIKVQRPKTFFLDTRIALQYRAKCQMVFLVRDKVIGDDYNKCPDLLPVLVMTAKARMLDIFGTNYMNVKEVELQEAISDTDIVMIWLTSVRPEDSKIVATISVWPTCTTPLIEYLNVHTSQIYNIRSSQKLNHIFKSSCVMTLPGNYVNSITNKGDSLLAVQVQIH